MAEPLHEVSVGCFNTQKLSKNTRGLLGDPDFKPWVEPPWLPVPSFHLPRAAFLGSGLQIAPFLEGNRLQIL